MDVIVYIILIVIFIIIQFVCAKLIQSSPLMFKKPGFLVIFIFALINYILCVLLFIKTGIGPKSKGKQIVAFILIIVYAIFILIYSSICSLNGYSRIIALFIISLIVIGFTIGESCDSKYTLTFKDIDILANKTSFYIIVGLASLKLIQYKFIDFIPLPHLTLSLEDVITLIKHLVGFISIFSICPFSGLVEALQGFCKMCL